MKEFIIDISKHNGNIDFKKVKAEGVTHPEPGKVAGCIIRAVNDQVATDLKFLANVKGCCDNNIPWGAYLFANFYTNDVIKAAQSQADKLIGLVKQAGTPTLPLVLDTETNKPTLPITSEQLELFIKTFIGRVNNAGYECILYMSPGFSWFLPKKHGLSSIKLWAADYTGAINPVNGWKSIWLHQFTDKGKVAGIYTAVDINKKP